VKDYKYKITEVMPIYKAENYLREAIDSIINQDLGFKKNIQLVLVDDGSPDNSGKICDEYKEKFPENIVVIHKKNEGASSAREEGLKYAEGEFINFLDSDDILSKDAYRRAYKFFSKHKDETDVCAIPMYFFGEMHGAHPLNNKFRKKPYIANLETNPEIVQMAMSPAFFKKEAFDGVSFNRELVRSEDSRIILEILLKKPTLGLIPKAKYFYRKHGNDSLVGSSYGKSKNYSEYLTQFSEYSINKSKEKTGEIKKFVLNTIAYDLQWYFLYKTFPKNLTSSDISSFEQKLYKLLSLVGDELIFNQQYIDNLIKLYILSKTHKLDLDVLNESFVLKENNAINNIATKLFPSVDIDFLNIKKDHIEITGGYYLFDNIKNFDKLRMFCKVNGKTFTPKIDNKIIEETALDSVYTKKTIFSFILPLTQNATIDFYFKFEKELIKVDSFIFTTYSPFSIKLKNAYYYNKSNKLMITFGRKTNSINVKKSNCIKRFFKEILYLGDLLLKNNDYKIQTFGLRLLYDLTKPFHKKPIWIVSDRINKAGDNGEAMFRYITSQKNKKIKTYFAIGDCEDKKEIKKVGKTLYLYSLNRSRRFIKPKEIKYVLYHLYASTLVSAHADGYTISPIGPLKEFFRDIYCEKHFVFLQHGIIQSDLSGWLNRFNRNITGFVCSAKREYGSIAFGNYFYGKDKVWLTGLPRYDRLYNKKEKIITFMPTWRKYEFIVHDQNGVWHPVKNYKNSEYFNFYNSLINNKELISAAEKFGYKLEFMPHPNVITTIDMYDKNDKVEFLSINTPYRDIYARSSLIISDYSSAVFDFAYLKKPVIYAQFDKERFFSGDHVGLTGYFDYEKDGFGEVTYDLQSTVDLLIDYMKNGCQMKDRYKKRVDKFFAFSDKKNCERVYKKILKL